jgi:hypothetical protein
MERAHIRMTSQEPPRLGGQPKEWSVTNRETAGPIPLVPDANPDLTVQFLLTEYPEFLPVELELRSALKRDLIDIEFGECQFYESWQTVAIGGPKGGDPRIGSIAPSVLKMISDFGYSPQQILEKTLGPEHAKLPSHIEDMLYYARVFGLLREFLDSNCHQGIVDNVRAMPSIIWVQRHLFRVTLDLEKQS